MVLMFDSPALSLQSKCRIYHKENRISGVNVDKRNTNNLKYADDICDSLEVLD